MASTVSVHIAQLPPELHKVAEGVVRLYTYGAPYKRTVDTHYARSARYESPVHILLGRSSIAVLATLARKLASRVDAHVKPVKIWTSEDNPYVSITIPMQLRYWVHGLVMPFLRFIGGPEYKDFTVTTTLVVDTQTDKVVVHQDEWDGLGPALPAWLKLLLGSWTLPVSVLFTF